MNCMVLSPGAQWEVVCHVTHCTPVCNPHLSLFVFLLNLQIYINAVWHGWAIPMFLFLAILRLSLNYLIARYLHKYQLTLLSNALFERCFIILALSYKLLLFLTFNTGKFKLKYPKGHCSVSIIFYCYWELSQYPLAWVIINNPSPLKF